MTIMLKKLSAAVIVMILITALLSGCGGARSGERTGALTPSETQRVSSMEGYNSRFNPAHLSSSEAWELVSLNVDAIVIDVRTKESYEERRISTAINVPFENVEEFASTIVPDTDRIIICYCFCDDKGGSALAAAEILIELGFTNAFYMEPDDEWTYEGSLTSGSGAAGSAVEMSGESIGGGNTHKYVSGIEAKEIYDLNPGSILLDVRNQDEYDAGHIDGSVLIPVSQLEGRLDELPDREVIIIVYCKAGGRSATAYGILSANGYSNLYDMQKFSNWPGG